MLDGWTASHHDVVLRISTRHALRGVGEGVVLSFIMPEIRVRNDVNSPPCARCGGVIIDIFPRTSLRITVNKSHCLSGLLLSESACRIFTMVRYAKSDSVASQQHGTVQNSKEW